MGLTDFTKNVSSGNVGAGTFTTLGSFVGPGGTVAGLGLDVAMQFLEPIMNWYGAQEQKKENDRLNKIALQESAKDREQRRYEVAGNLALGNRQAGIQEKNMFLNNAARNKELGIASQNAATNRADLKQKTKQSNWEIKTADDKIKWDKQIGLLNGITTMLNQNPDAANRLINIQKQRSA